MTPKPKIQYVGMFYVHGSEAKKLEEEQRRKEAKTKLPLERLRKIEVVYVDPIAILGIAVALIMLFAMVTGAMQITRDWEAYEQMSDYVSELNLSNARLTRQYRSSVDMEKIRSQAEELGMIPREDVPVRTISVSIPEEVPEPSRLERIGEFLAGLFE